MARIGFIGIGKVGWLALQEFLHDNPNVEVIAIDCVDKSSLVNQLRWKVEFIKACKPTEILGVLRNVDMAALALPSDAAYPILEKILEK